MKKRTWGTAMVAGAVLLVGCGGGTFSSLPVTGPETTGSTGGLGTTGDTTGGTQTGSEPTAGTYDGTYTSASFSQGGPSVAGASGSARLTIEEDGDLTLTLGDARVEGSLTSTATVSSAFAGTFTSDGESRSVRGTVTRSGSRLSIRFTDYVAGSQSNGTRYSASVS